MARFLSTEPVLLNLPTAISVLPERGSMIRAHSVLSSPGGGYLGMVAVSRMDVETGMLSMLGTGPNSFMIRRDLKRNGVKILTNEAIGDIGVAIQLVEDGGDTTVIISSGVEADLSIDQVKQVELLEGDVLLVHGSAIGEGEAGEQFASWVAGIEDFVKVVLAPSPLIDQIDPNLWEPMLRRADILTMNKRETSLLPKMLKLTESAPELEDLLKPDCIQVTRLGSDGCKYRIGDVEKELPAFQTKSVDTTGVGSVHVAVMCGALARGQSIDDALFMANAAGAVMVSHTYAFPVPSMREIADLMTFGVEGSGAPS
ncbi:MAG: PfkB family carbohydrate kinase [Actinomycetaceae bacterium]|nr:PfkB family carbohydrate kinase [Actinomycetaceae bacterium]